MTTVDTVTGVVTHGSHAPHQSPGPRALLRGVGRGGQWGESQERLWAMVQGGCRSGNERRSVGSVPMAHILSAVAWPYANGPRHLGHVAGFGVPSDVFSRYMRMAGHDVLMVSGTDEHGTPILVEADKEGTTALELADRSNRIIVTELAALGCSYDLFTRTTTRNHYAVAQEMFRQVHANGYLVEQTTGGGSCPPSGCTSGSTPSSATSRHRSSGRAGSATPSAGGSGGTTRSPSRTTSWARTTSRSTPRSGRPSCWPTRVGGTGAANPVSTASSTCPPRWCPRST